MTKNTITLKDVYDVVNRLEDKMDKRLTDLEDRMEVNEAFRNKAAVSLGVFTTFFTAFASWFWSDIMKR